MKKEELIFISLVFDSLIEIGAMQCGSGIYGSGDFSISTGIKKIHVGMTS